MRVLVTGGTGLLGLSLIRNKPIGIVLFAGCYNFPKDRLVYADRCRYVQFDIRNKEMVERVFDENMPDVVIHAASLGNVDYCEKNKEEAWQTNVAGSRNIIEGCKRSNARLIFTSSNAVFDGTRPPYGEEDETNPLDYYGKTKLETEGDVSRSGLQYAIVRLMTMYGWNHPLERQNPVTWVLERLSKAGEINVVDDIYNNYLFAESAAEALWAIVSGNREGIYHIGGPEVSSRYQLALATAEVFGLKASLIRPVDSSFFPNIAPRPKNTSYNIGKMERDLRVEAIRLRQGLELMRDNPPREWGYDWQKKGFAHF